MGVPGLPDPLPAPVPGGSRPGLGCPALSPAFLAVLGSEMLPRGGVLVVEFDVFWYSFVGSAGISS